MGTGIPGRIFRGDRSGSEGTVFLEAADEHVRCLYRDSRGWLCGPGTSGGWLLLRAWRGTARRERSLRLAAKAEISALAGVSSDGEIWAAAVSTRTGGGAARRPRPGAAPPAKEKKTPSPVSAPGWRRGGRDRDRDGDDLPGPAHDSDAGAQREGSRPSWWEVLFGRL